MSHSVVEPHLSRSGGVSSARWTRVSLPRLRQKLQVFGTNEVASPENRQSNSLDPAGRETPSLESVGARAGESPERGETPWWPHFPPPTHKARAA